MNSELKLGWCSYKAAKYACENWHYSKCMPAGKLIKVGVWENEKFIGAVIFGRGANNNMGKEFLLKSIECAELVRVALDKHKNNVTRIVSIAIKKLKNLCSGLRLIYSYADSEQGHTGKIYQAGNWIYTGVSISTETIINGKRMHNRSVHSIYGCNSLEYIRKNVDKNAKHIQCGAKYRYLMPLDKDMRIKAMKKAMDYPKCAQVV